MNIKNVMRNSMCYALAMTFIISQAPHQAWATSTEKGSLTIDLFPDEDDSDTGLAPTKPTPILPPATVGDGAVKSGAPVTPPVTSTPRPGMQTPTTSTPTKVTPTTSSKTSMAIAKVSAEYACPLFDNRPHAELISSIDALSREVKASPECTGQPSVKALEENGKAIKDNVAILQGMMALQDPNAVNIAQVDQSMTAAITAVSNIGDILNNNAFTNSKCGREAMSVGKTLLALNDVIGGLAPYALFAVSLNAALAPALPYVIGGAVATSGISAFTKYIDSNTLDMSNPEFRKALLTNTCQFTNVAKKVRFMQLAQSGRIDKITKELEKSVQFYNTSFKNPSKELTSLLSYRSASLKAAQTVETQLAKDRADMATIQKQLALNSDDLMVCTLASELTQWAKDGKTFPSSIINNLELATSQGSRSEKLQAITMKSMHANSVKKVEEAAQLANVTEEALKSCAQSGRSWFLGLQQSLTLTNSIVSAGKIDLERELSRSAEYNQWKAQYTRIEAERTTIKRVEKAMQELAKDNSIIDRSELAQRMVILKAGLFGSRTTWFGFIPPPVLAWINHTKKMHEQAISAFVIGMKAVREDSYSLTEVGRGMHMIYTREGSVPKIKEERKARAISKALSNFNLREVQMGTREHELACQRMESTWLDWSAAIDHLGAVKLFCEMIDPVLDVKIDTSIVTACRGIAKLNGEVMQPSIVETAKQTLVRKGFQADATLISKRMKDLKCPTPDVSVMN